MRVYIGELLWIQIVYDFDGEDLSNLQPNNFTDCFSEYLCTESHKILQEHKLT
jgi:hypothetical protein